MKTQLTLSTPYPTYKLHLLGICLVFITACSVFKEKSFYETDSLQRQEIKRATQSESTAMSQSLRIYSSSDSTDRQSFAEIYPKGAFRYSPAEGFSGDAERLVINERLRSAQERSDALRVMQSTQVRKAMNEELKSREHTRKKEKQVRPRNLSWLYLAGCGLIFLGIWWFRSRW